VTFDRLYRISVYLMLFLGTLALNIDMGRDNALAPLYPLAVAVVGLFALVTVDRNPALGLPRPVAGALGLASIGLSLVEYRYDPSLLVLAMGHWLVYLQLIKMLLPKTVEDDWFLFLLSLVQVVVGAFQPGDNVGTVLVAWALVALWTLRLFHLRREAAQSLAPQLPAGADPYPGLVDRSFLASATKVAVLTLFLGGLIFLLMPRWNSDRGRRNRQPLGLTQHLTGFSDTVRLGQMGEILESDAVVMSVETFDESEERVPPPVEGLWRGVTLTLYRDARWSRGPAGLLEFDGPKVRPTIPPRHLRQRIKLEPSDTDVLFGLRPIAVAAGPDLAFNTLDGTLFRSDMRPTQGFVVAGNRHPGAYDYEVTSSADPGGTQPFERYPGEYPPGVEPRADEPVLPPEDLLDVPEDVRAGLAPLVASILEGVPDDPAERARALERFLRDGEYTYSLRMTVVDPGLDPLLDFLLNRKEGHCEYYGSALTLMLRTAGIPARMVNGFKGGDYNNLAGILYVRQKHAHSWTEALVGRGPAGMDNATNRAGDPIWLTLDPTPSRQREEVVAQVGGLSSRFRLFSDTIRYVWVFYIIGFDSDRQERLIYGPIRTLFEEAARGFGVMGTQLRRLLGWLTDFPSVSAFFSVRGFFVSVFSLLLLVGLARLARRLGRRYGWGRRRAAAAEGELASGVLTYRRLAALLEGLGLRRPPAETPREFARRAGELLAARGTEERHLADLPADVVANYYGVRYGARPIPPETLADIEARLDAMEAALRPAGPAP
jgi:transglutaminase-like putative cysteine protease